MFDQRPGRPKVLLCCFLGFHNLIPLHVLNTWNSSDSISCQLQ